MARIQKGTSVGEHFLIRLRIVHPIVASLVAAGMMLLASLSESNEFPHRKGRREMGLGVGIPAGHSRGCKCAALCTGLDAAYSLARRGYPVDRNNSSRCLRG